jgi:hypothetical protein
MARDARWVIKTTLEQLRDELTNAVSPHGTPVDVVNLVEKRLTFNLDLAGIRQTPGPKAAKTTKAE